MNAGEASRYLTELLHDTGSMMDYIRRIPPEIGRFRIEEKSTRRGLALYDWQLCFRQDISVEMRGNWGVPSVQFIFFTDQGMEWRFRENKNIVSARRGELCVYQSSDLTSVGTYQGGHDFCCRSLQVSSALFDQILSSYFEGEEKHRLERFLRGVTTLPITDRMRRILAEVSETDQYSSGTAALCLEGKLTELLSVCLEEMTVRDRTAGQKNVLSPTDLETILEVKERIDRGFSSSLSLSSLAKDAHISVSKLSRGFSAAVGMPLHAYIIEKRLENAALLLTEGRMNVSQAASACGYSNMSHFSAAFKKRYGVLPRDYLK